MGMLLIKKMLSGVCVSDAYDFAYVGIKKMNQLHFSDCNAYLR